MTASPLTLWLYVPLAASAAFAALAPLAARRAPGRLATWLLTVGSALFAVAAVVLPLLALMMVVGQWAPLADLGHWSAHLLALKSPAGRRAWEVALAVLAVQRLAMVAVMWRRGRPLLRAWRAAAATASPLLVVPDARLAAFALPGWPGRIVATQGLLQTLDPAERRVVLAHEQAHLDDRHDLHLAAAAFSSAVNPLLVGVPRAVRLATERWADERAATVVGDRLLVARTIAHVATGQREATVPRGAMAATGSEVTARVRSLVHPTSRRSLLVLAVAAVALVPALSTSVAAARTNAVFQHAEQAAVVPTTARVPGTPSFKVTP